MIDCFSIYKKEIMKRRGRGRSYYTVKTLKTTRRPLLQRNPFRSIGVNQRSTKIFVGPLKREGITSVENEERARQGQRLAQLSNAGMVKQMKDLGIIPDDMGVDMSQFTGNVAALPSGITSLENVQREGDVAHQIEQFNAGILNQEHREQKALMDIAKKRKQSEYRGKIIQWLAETDELDEVPAEFAEEVAAYYRQNRQKQPNLEEEVARKRKQRKEREEEKERKKLMRQGYWQPSSAPFSSIMPSAAPSTRYTTNTGLLQHTMRDPNPTEEEERRLVEEMARAEEERRAQEFRELYEQYMRERDTGEGVINSGWRAPRLHKLVRPLKRFEIEEGPDKIIEDQQQALDDRRSMYKDEQTKQRGTAPPKDMIERAMPKLAEPFFANRPLVQRFRTAPDFGITLHPFVFPNKKYLLHTGVF